MLRNKKGALELSIGTVVIVVLGMSMLILGLVLVRGIFTGAQYNVDQINEKVRGEINKLFNEEGSKVIIYLPNNEAEVKKEESFGVAFGIKNTAQGESQPGNFEYTIKVGSVEESCTGLTKEIAENYISLGRTGSFSLLPGAEPVYRVVKIRAPESAPLCEIWYDLEVIKDGQPYDTSFFIIKITG